MTEEEFNKKWPMRKIPDAVRKAAVEWSSHLFIRDRVKLAQDMLEATEEYRNDYAETQSCLFAEWIMENERFLPMLSQPIPELYKEFKNDPEHK